MKSWTNGLVACVLACLAYVPSGEKLPAQVPSGWVVSETAATPAGTYLQLTTPIPDDGLIMFSAENNGAYPRGCASQWLYHPMAQMSGSVSYVGAGPFAHDPVTGIPQRITYSSGRSPPPIKAGAHVWVHLP